MSTFSQLAALGNGVGVAYLLEAMSDDVGTVNSTFAFATHDGLFDQTFAYEARIVELGDLQRGFGVNGTVAASTISVRLNNQDGGCDALLLAANAFGIRWRFRCVLYDSSNPSDFAIKTLGMFVCLDFPKRDDRSVVLQLADDSFGRAAELAIPPTAEEAFAVALVPATTQPPVPIAMGGGEIPCLPPASYDPTATSMNFVLCATTDTSAVDPNEVQQLNFRGGGLNYNAQGGSGTYLVVPRNGPLQSGVSIALWTLAKTASLTKDGRTWQVLYITLYVDNLRSWLTDQLFLAQDSVSVPGFGTYPVTVGLAYFNTQLLPTLQISALGPKFSSITYSGGLDAFGSHAVTVRAPDIVYDLLRYYSRGLTSAQVNQASFTAATAAFPLFFFKAHYYFTNFVQNVTSIRQGSVLARNQVDATANMKGLLLRAVTDLCQGGLFDIVTAWDGAFTAHVLANTFSLQTTTRVDIDETLMIGINDRVPSQGERWAPYNRVVFTSNGRIVDNATAIAAWGTVLTRTINDSAVDVFEAFSGTDFGIGTFNSIGVLESVVRPIIAFDYPLDALDWELGQFVTVTWNRGASGQVAYTGAVFRIESLALHPTSGRVSVSAVWINDLATSNPYLLDDETLLVRSKGALTGTADPDPLGNTCLFGGTINLTTMGVQVGDILVLRDSTEVAAAFLGNSTWRITGLPSTSQVQVAGTFDGFVPGSIANADWSIVRGATTYPTAVSDPANYPSGGAMYGKQSASGTFSNGSTANKFTNAG